MVTCINFVLRQELIHYYEELSREAERREKRAVWLASRHALKNQRDTFLEQEQHKLDEMKNEITKKLETTSPRKKWATGVKNESSVSNSSTVQDLIYHSDTVKPRRTLPTIPQATQSTAQDMMYPDMVSSTGHDDGSQISGDTVHGRIKGTRATDSTVQDLMYPTSRESVVTGPDSDGGDSTVSQSATTVTAHGTRTLTRAMDSTAQNLIYHSSDVPPPTTVSSVSGGGVKTMPRAADSTAQNLLYHNDQAISQTDGSKGSGGRTMTGAMDSTAQNLMYHSSEEQMVAHKSTRGVGGAFQSTIQEQMYGDDGGTITISHRRFEPSGEMKDILYGHDQSEDSHVTTSRGSEQSSVIKDILYPGTNQSHVNDSQMKSTRGSAPASTIQNLMYRSASITEGIVDVVLMVCFVVMVIA